MIADTENLAKVLKVLGDANRLGIVISIGKKARSVTEIINTTGLSQTLVSFHLRALREAEIVTTKRNGPFILYSLSDPSLLDILIKLSRTVEHNGSADAETPEPAVQRAEKAKRTSR